MKYISVLCLIVLILISSVSCTVGTSPQVEPSETKVLASSNSVQEVDVLPAQEGVDMVVVHGEILSLERDDEENVVGVLLLNLQTETEMFFHIGEFTHKDNDAQLIEGEKITITFDGITTRSIPPQGTAMEISGYTL